MNTSTSSRGFARRPVLALAAAVTLVLGLSAPVHRAEAGFPVIDGTNLSTNIFNWVEDIYEYATEAGRWTSELSRIQRQLVQLQAMVTNIMPANGQKLVPVDLNYMVKERCGAGSIAGNLGSMITLNPEGDIRTQQKQICAAIQQMQNRKYNDTLAFMDTTMKEMERAMKELKNRRNSTNDEGNVTASTNDNVNMSNEIQLSMDTFNSRMNAYDQYIAALTNRQQQLASLALRGKKDVLGQIVKTATLQGALSVGD